VQTLVDHNRQNVTTCLLMCLHHFHIEDLCVCLPPDRQNRNYVLRASRQVDLGLKKRATSQTVKLRYAGELVFFLVKTAASWTAGVTTDIWTAVSAARCTHAARNYGAMPPRLINALFTAAFLLSSDTVFVSCTSARRTTDSSICTRKAILSLGRCGL